MGILSRKILIAAIFSLITLSPVQFLSAQSQGPTGFDWIGTDAANISGQRCFPAVFNPAGSVFSQVVTSWVPPGSQSNKYQLKDFEWVGGLIGQNPADPPPINMLWQTGRFQLSIYDSLEALRTAPETGYRAQYRYQANWGGGIFQQVNDCKVYSFGYLYDMPCGKLKVDLNLLKQEGHALFKTAAGEPTTIPLELEGSKRYYFAMTGFSTALDPKVCFLRTNADLVASRSPIPNPSLSVPMNATQCEEAGFPPPCLFVFSHSDYYWTVNTEPFCDPNRTFVNSTEAYSQIPPFLNPSPDGELPRTCGGADHLPCCERTFASHAGFKLGVQPRMTKGSQINTTAVSEVCHEPGNC